MSKLIPTYIEQGLRIEQLERELAGRRNSKGKEHITYKEFLEYVRTKCVYTAIYLDGEGREILVIPMLDAFAMVNDAAMKDGGK